MPRKVTPCGTLTAYNRHRRNGEAACEACLEAKREDRARRVAEQRSEQAVAAAEVREAMTPEDDMLALLREQRDVLRSHTISGDTPPSAVAGLSKQLVAILEQIDERGRLLVAWAIWRLGVLSVSGSGRRQRVPDRRRGC